MKRTVLAILATLAASLAVAPTAHAAEPCPYVVTVANNTDADDDGLIEPGAVEQCTTYEIATLVAELRYEQHTLLATIDRLRVDLGRAEARLTHKQATIDRLRDRLAAQS